MGRLTIREYGVLLAETAAQRSEDPYMRAGAAVIDRRGAVLSLGYNGAPSGVEIDWEDRDSRRLRVIHAEANALRYVLPGQAELVATTHLPCLECLKLIRAQGILSVAYRHGLPPYYDPPLIMAVADEFGMLVVRVEDDRLASLTTEPDASVHRPITIRPQWKGTNLCADWTCPDCDYENHTDGFTFVGIACEQCGRMFRLPDDIEMSPEEGWSR